VAAIGLFDLHGKAGQRQAGHATQQNALEGKRKNAAL
jgi:hypothetical protein